MIEAVGLLAERTRGGRPFEVPEGAAAPLGRRAAVDSGRERAEEAVLGGEREARDGRDRHGQTGDRLVGEGATDAVEPRGKGVRAGGEAGADAFVVLPRIT